MCASLPASSSSGYCKEQPAKGEIFHWLIFALPPLEEHEHRSYTVVTQGGTPTISCEKKQQPVYLKKLFTEFESPPSPQPRRGVKGLHTSSYFASLTAIGRDDSKVPNLSSRYH